MRRFLLSTASAVLMAACLYAPSTAPASGPASPKQSDSKAEPPAKTPAVQENALPDSKSPEVVTKVKPDYPLVAQEQQVQGQVVVKISVSEAGDVENAEVISGSPELVDSVLRAVKKWKFKPFIKDGKPVKFATSLNFNFAFKDKVRDQSFGDSASTLVPPGAGASGQPSRDIPERVRVSSAVTAGMVVHKVSPVYPPDAKRARIQGTVILAAIISKEGSIKNLRVISGPPELVDAASGAVQQWRYRPYVLKGEPVEVDTQITVNFQLR